VVTHLDLAVDFRGLVRQRLDCVHFGTQLSAFLQQLGIAAEFIQRPLVVGQDPGNPINIRFLAVTDVGDQLAVVGRQYRIDQRIRKPAIVVDCMKSQVQTSFLQRAG
jgi:hypothetical protein